MEWWVLTLSRVLRLSWSLWRPFGVSFCCPPGWPSQLTLAADITCGLVVLSLVRNNVFLGWAGLPTRLTDLWTSLSVGDPLLAFAVAVTSSLLVVPDGKPWISNHCLQRAPEVHAGTWGPYLWQEVWRILLVSNPNLFSLSSMIIGLWLDKHGCPVTLHSQHSLWLGQVKWPSSGQSNLNRGDVYHIGARVLWQWVDLYHLIVPFLPNGT